jgi:hypothetical protein
VKIGHAETDLLIWSKPAGGSAHDDSGGFHGVVGRKFEQAVVDSSFVGCVMEDCSVQ